MIVRLDQGQADAVLGAMKAIALADADTMSQADRLTIEAAATVLLGRAEQDVDALEPRLPTELVEAIGEGDGRLPVRMLAVMSLVDGAIDEAKTDLVGEYAAVLDVHEAYLPILAEAAEGEIAAAAACMVRKNAESFPELDPTGIDEDAVAPFLPYRDGNADPKLEERYEALGSLPDQSFGRAFFEHFRANGFAFPGNENGLAEGFTTPHDSSHVLSGYSTSQQGELCVSTFIGAMHPDHPMAAEVLPVLFSWHLGIKLNEIAKSSTGAFEPRRFWTAWERGAAIKVDIVDEGWDFWGAVSVPLEELRRDYGVKPIEAALLA